MALAWRRASARRLTTAMGQRLTVLHPGYPGSGPGPDFRDAILARPGGRLERGDVEVHQHAADWVRHGHHRDPRYLGVILQVVGQRGLWTVAPLADGRLAPIVALPPGGSSGRGTPRAAPSPAESCRLELPAAALVAARSLHREGLRRFLSKVRRFQAHLLVVPAEQVLYEGVAEAAGYMANREAFRELARAVPATELGRLAARGATVDDRRQRLSRALLQGSGLAALQAAGSPEGRVDPALWNVAPGRPGNGPRARVEALAAFLAVVLPGGLVAVLLQLLERPAAAVPGAARRLLAGQEAWAAAGARGGAGGHQGPVEETTARGAFGRARADEIAVNILLPFALALGRARPASAELARRALAAYLVYPSLPDYSILRAAGALLPEGLPVRGACLQQGLLHRVEKLCRRRPCWGCPLQGRT